MADPCARWPRAHWSPPIGHRVGVICRKRQRRSWRMPGRCYRSTDRPPARSVAGLKHLASLHNPDYYERSGCASRPGRRRAFFAATASRSIDFCAARPAGSGRSQSSPRQAAASSCGNNTRTWPGSTSICRRRYRRVSRRRSQSSVATIWECWSRRPAPVRPCLLRGHRPSRGAHARDRRSPTALGAVARAPCNSPRHEPKADRRHRRGPKPAPRRRRHRDGAGRWHGATMSQG